MDVLPPKYINGKISILYLEQKCKLLEKDNKFYKHKLFNETKLVEKHRQWGIDCNKETGIFKRKNICLKEQLNDSKQRVKRREYSYNIKSRDYNDLKLVNKSLAFKNKDLESECTELKTKLANSVKEIERLKAMLNQYIGYDESIFADIEMDIDDQIDQTTDVISNNSEIQKLEELFD